MNPWFLLGAALAVIVAYFYGHNQGAEIERGAWSAREADINAKAAIKIEAANQRVRDAEHAHAEQLAAVSGAYQKKLAEKNNALNTALNGLRAGTGRLFVNATCPPAGGNTADRTAAGPGGRDGPTRAELSAPDSEFLLRLGAEADGVVLQLTACQQVIRSDRGKITPGR